MSVWARTFWVALVLVVPGGFLLFLTYTFARAVLSCRRALARTNGGEANFRDVLASVRLKDVIREVRAAI